MRTWRFIAVALLCLLVAGSAAPAFAAPSDWQSVDVTLQSEQQSNLLLVSGELPQDVKLPYETELAVPSGTELQWIGEILGGPAAQDPELKYVKSTAQGMDVYRFTLTKSRIAQVEGRIQGMSTVDGTNHTTALKWTAWQALPEVRVSERIPTNAKIAQADPDATTAPGDSGYSYYTKTVKNPEAGDVLDLSFSYSIPAGSASTGSGAAAAPSPATGIIIPVIVLLVFVAGFGLLAYKVQRKMAAKSASFEPQKPKGKQPKRGGSSATAAVAREDDSSAEAQAPPARRAKPAAIVLVLVGIFVVGFVIAGSRGTSAQVTDGKITKSFGAASPCASASIPVMASEGVDFATQGEQLVAAFTGKEGVGDVTLDIARSVVDITFCESSQSEDSVRQILASTGLVSVGAAPSAAAPATATLDPSGDKQSASVDTAGGSFSPGTVVLKAGVPAEIEFGKAEGCLTEVIFSGLGVTQDLTTGPTTVKLPALDPGTYEFACAMGHQGGQIVVE